MANSLIVGGLKRMNVHIASRRLNSRRRRMDLPKLMAIISF
jgi:hypothetical protein